VMSYTGFSNERTKILSSIVVILGGFAQHINEQPLA
jgi:hypothetical protein